MFRHFGLYAVSGAQLDVVGRAQCYAASLAPNRSSCDQAAPRRCPEASTGDLGYPTDAVAFGDNALAIAESLRDVPLLVTGNLYLGGAYLWTGDYRRAEDLIRKVMPLLEGDLIRERFGLPGFPGVVVRYYLALIFADQGKLEEGIAHGQEALRVAEALDHPTA